MYTSGPLGTILLVDDDVNITDLLRFNLGSEGFGISVIPMAKDVNAEEIPDLRLIIVDACAQQYSGLDLVEDLKSNLNTINIPVILCTSVEGEDIIIDAFDRGVDDFLAKPFSLRELIARVKAVLRRHPRKPTADVPRKANAQLSVSSLNLHVDTVTQRVVEDGNVIPLTKTEYAILLFLLKNQNSFFTRNDICNEVWKDEVGTNERIVDTNISRLRKKLGESGKHIVNRYGLGYAFLDTIS